VDAFTQDVRDATFHSMFTGDPDTVIKPEDVSLYDLISKRETDKVKREEKEQKTTKQF
jgi:hypothetical protein